MTKNSLEISVSKQDLQLWLLIFFRYSLGRHTYIVSDSCKYLMKYWRIMPKHNREQIIGDIEYYLNHTEDSYTKDWKELLEFAKKNL